MYCNYCGKEFEPWKTRYGWIEDQYCQACREKKWAHKLVVKEKDKYCIQCGRVLEKTVCKVKGGKAYLTSARKLFCEDCKKPAEKKLKPRFCQLCGAQLTGRQRKYCDACLPSETNNRTSLQWYRNNREKALIAQFSRYNNDLLNILYECPHNHPKKHDHHFDYTRPFEVIRLCPDCHSKEHARLRYLENQAQEA